MTRARPAQASREVEALRDGARTVHVKSGTARGEEGLDTEGGKRRERPEGQESEELSGGESARGEDSRRQAPPLAPHRSAKAEVKKDVGSERSVGTTPTASRDVKEAGGETSQNDPRESATEEVRAPPRREESEEEWWERWEGEEDRMWDRLQEGQRRRGGSKSTEGSRKARRESRAKAPEPTPRDTGVPEERRIGQGSRRSTREKGAAHRRVACDLVLQSL